MESLNNVKQRHCEFARAAQCFAVSFHFVVYGIVGVCVCVQKLIPPTSPSRECAHHRNIDETIASTHRIAHHDHTARDDD